MTDRTAPHSNDQPAAVPGVASQDVIALVEALPGVALLLAADPPRFTMLAMNAGRLAETSTTREETVGRPLFEVFPEADATSRALEAPRPERTSLETVIRTRVPEHLSLLRLDLRRPDGASEVRYWAARNIPVLGPDGAVRYLLHQAEDVTAAVLGGDALAHAEDALRRQNERLAAQTRALELERSRLATVFAQAPSVLAIVRGPDYVLEMANEAYLALNGHRDVLGKPLLDAIPELRGQGFDRLLDEVVATGVPFVGREVPIWLSTLPGAPPEERFFDFAYLPLLEPDETGNPVRVGVIAHGNDITAQVRARREE
ncbi:MAG TPA: PAS domain-containing protein, partial [Gemmatimonadaceae bacterium]|nr:PAS domain-containing protein [Gemmatimonadaceae bacterium]